MFPTTDEGMKQLSATGYDSSTSSVPSIRSGASTRVPSIRSGASTHLVFEGPYEPGESASIQIKPPTGNVSGADALAVELVEATGPRVRVSETRVTYELSCPGGGDDGREE
jgi:hypothetical protein